MLQKSQRGKARPPDAIPIEILKFCPPVFVTSLNYMFSAVVRLGCVPRDWDHSILIALFEGKRSPALPAGHRPFRLILIISNVFDRSPRGAVECQNE